MSRCVIISASPQYDIEFLKSQVNKDDYVICADMGYEIAVKSNITPDLIVGDFDSLKIPLPNNIEIIRLNTHKDDTDTISCIKEAVKRGFKEIVIFCATGGRIDHTFSNLSSLLYMKQQGVEGKILTPYEEITILLKGSYTFKNKENTVFSLFPFGCEKVNVSYSGVEYILDNYDLESYFPLGISNVFNKNQSQITINSGTALLIINKFFKNN